MDIEAIVRAAIILFVIMDPFASMPVFLSLSKRVHSSRKGMAVNKAALVAGLLLITFTLAGPPFLSLIGVTMQSFMIGGGIMLLLISILMVLGMRYGQVDERRMDVAAVLIAIPLMTGPGSMTAAIILASTYGIENAIIAILLATIGMRIILRGSGAIYNKIGHSGIELLSRISGLLLAAIAVEYIRIGLGM